MRGAGPLRAVALSALLALGCGGAREGERPVSGAGEAGGRVRLVDVTREAGIDFVHHNAASPRRLLPETMGSGAAFFDFDGDGWVDLFLVDGAPLDGGAGGDRGGPAGARGSAGALYRNLGGGRFADVTARAGLGAPGPYGMGAAVGDIDNDGDPDLFVSGVGGDRLWRNRGDGRFEEVSRPFGLGPAGFGASAAFLDADGDGWLDLFAGRYVTWSPATDLPCSPDGARRAYCTPEGYPGESSRLYRNLGGEGFEDVTGEAGVLRPEGKTLGVVPLDADGDGRVDVAVANDTVRNFLFLNRGDGRFREVGVEAGMAYSESGATRGGMGIDAGDADGDGLADLAVGNFAQEMSALYRQRRIAVNGAADGDGVPAFVDDAAQVGIGLPTLMTLAFGTLLVDADSDGILDLFFANGHIEPEIAAIRPGQTYAQPLQLFLGDGAGGFRPVGEAGGPAGRAAAGAGDARGGGGGAAESGAPGAGAGDAADPLGVPLVGRGLAAADADRDGDPDFAVTQNGHRARLLRNDSPRRSWLRLELVGTASNRTGYGAAVTATVGERRLVRRLVSGRSYLSASEPVLLLGLGESGTAAAAETGTVDRLEVAWPSGRRRVYLGLAADRSYRLTEPED